MKYEEAVRLGRMIVREFDKNQWQLGELAHSLEPLYGKKTLERYSDDIGINFHSLRNCRTVYRAWMKSNYKPNFSVAKALAKLPNKEMIVRREPEITVREAILTARLHKDRTSEKKYRDMVIHRIVARLCRITNRFLDQTSEEAKLIKELVHYESMDMEYLLKVQKALHDARNRIDDAMLIIMNPNFEKPKLEHVEIEVAKRPT